MKIKWPSDIVYQIFPDRFFNGDPSNDVRTGEYRWHGQSVRKSTDPEILGSPRLHQHSFYGGDLAGVIQKIPHLVSLGITAVYLTPIFTAGSSHKYDADDYLEIDPHFGGREAYRELVARLHASGIKIVLDGVFNHTSFNHSWYRNPSARRRFYCMRDGRRTMTWMNGSSLPKLNPERPEVERALLGVISAWPEVDGWRLDAAHLLPVRFLQKLKRKVESINPKNIVVMEDWTDSSGHFSDGLCDGVTNFLFRDAVERFFVEDCSPETLLKRLACWICRYAWPNVIQSWNHLDNHDTYRMLTRVGGDRDRYKLAQVLQFTLPGTPMLYQGDEIGMTGHHDADARLPMVWNERFWDRDIFNHTRFLIRLRKKFPVFSAGRWNPLLAVNSDRVLAYERVQSSGVRAVVGLNDGYAPHRLRLGAIRETVPPRGYFIRVRRGGSTLFQYRSWDSPAAFPD